MATFHAVSLFRLCCTGSLMMFSCFSIAGEAGRYVVAKSGGDFATISEAVAMGSTCNSPVVIDVMPGLYIENINLNGSHKCLHIRGAGMNLTTIRGSGGASPVVNSSIQCAGCAIPGPIEISNIKITSNKTQEGVSANYGNIRITNATISDTTTAATANNGTLDIKNSIIKGNAWGVSSSPGSSRIESSVITDNTASGVIGFEYVINNTIQRNGGYGIFTGYTRTNINSLISGNIVTDNKNSGLYVVSTTKMVIQNNKLINNSPYDVEADWANPDSTLVFNVYDKPQTAVLKKMFNVNSKGAAW